MHLKQLRSSVLIATVLAVIATLGLTSPGLTSSASAANDPQVAEHTVSTRAQDAAASYWTFDRLLSARPGDDLLIGHTLSNLLSVVEVGVPQLIEGRQAGLDLGGLLDGLLSGSPTAANGGIYSGGGQVVKTTGKVFFTMGGEDFQCSGSSVKAATKDLVVTAGHCVNQGPGAFATNFVFIPAYNNGKAPYGTFPARKLTTTNQFKKSGDLNYDVGMVAVNKVKGHHLSDRVGAQGIAFNQARGATTYAFGYPAETPYDGSKIAWCHGKTVADTVGNSQDQGLNCNLTGGASGGPWLMKYNESTGLGVANSVNSFKYESGGLLGLGARSGAEMYGPYFGSVVQSLYATAQRM